MLIPCRRLRKGVVGENVVFPTIYPSTCIISPARLVQHRLNILATKCPFRACALDRTSDCHTHCHNDVHTHCHTHKDAHTHWHWDSGTRGIDCCSNCRWAFAVALGDVYELRDVTLCPSYYDYYEIASSSLYHNIYIHRCEFINYFLL